MQVEKEYLGDSIYAEYDGYGVSLTTENGIGPTNGIYLEAEVLSALNRYMLRAKEAEAGKENGGADFGTAKGT